MQLDDAYANGAHIPQAETYPPRWQAMSEVLRAARASRSELGISYGASPRQAFDLFHPDGVAKGVLIFVHGGYWKAFGRSDWSHLAQGALDAGWAVAMPGYDLCPDVRISQITGQIAAAVEEIARRVDGPIVLAGHSAGGHLVARMLDSGVVRDDVRGRIARVAPISPVTDLAPLMQTSMNETLQIDSVEAQRESPVHMSAPVRVTVKIWVGADERPVFLQHADALAKAWDVAQVVVAGKHHFDVIDALEDEHSDLVQFLTQE